MSIFDYERFIVSGENFKQNDNELDVHKVDFRRIATNGFLTLVLAFGAKGSVNAQEDDISICETDPATCAELFNSDPGWDEYPPFAEFMEACVDEGHGEGSCAELVNADPSILLVPFGE